MKLFFRIFFLFWAVAFLLFALLQVNDPDPFIWVIAYLIPSVLCGLAAFRIYLMIPVYLMILVTAGSFFYIYPGMVGEWLMQEWEQKDLTMKTRFMEESREALGLLIVAVVLIAQVFAARKNKKINI